ncbi:sporulation peptidase YabG [Bacillaceae bacterium]
MSIRVGDIVVRISYGKDILFQVVEISEDKRFALLKGIEWRLLVDAPLDDLEKVKEEEIRERKKKTQEREDESFRLIKQEHRLLREKTQWFLTGNYRDENGTFDIPGKVLHIDGDSYYLKRCMNVYRQLQVPVHGIYVPEKEMPNRIGPLLANVQPNIVVITGHDSYMKKAGNPSDLEAYRHSKYFIQAVKEARKYERDKDALQIFAGACQSYFEALLEAGANFASAPNRINIHVLDPVYVVQKCAYTSIRDTVNIFDVVKNSISGMDGIGGIETKGTFRVGFPDTRKRQL